MNAEGNPNGRRWRPRHRAGHYESWFCRANHPSRPLAFWIRYTIFSPAGRFEDAIGERWAVFFDGERDTITAVKSEHPIDRCRFAERGLEVDIAGSRLDGASLRGEASCAGHRIEWELAYSTSSPPLLLLDRRLYAGPFPKAKALVGAPQAIYSGTLRVDGAEYAIEGWVGSQNHNWGRKHTDRYAWGQVAGFDDAPDAFLEVATAQVKLGPLMTPPLTVLVLRLEGEEHAFNTIGAALRARGSYGPSGEGFRWRFATRRDGTRIEGWIEASRRDFVALPYLDPPGGIKTCLNSKIARCELRVVRPGQPPRTLRTEQRAAFEILTSERDHGVPMLDFDG